MIFERTLVNSLYTLYSMYFRMVVTMQNAPVPEASCILPTAKFGIGEPSRTFVAVLAASADVEPSSCEH